MFGEGEIDKILERNGNFYKGAIIKCCSMFVHDFENAFKYAKTESLGTEFRLSWYSYMGLFQRNPYNFSVINRCPFH